MFTDNLRSNWSTLGFFLFFTIVFTLMTGALSVVGMMTSLCFIVGVNFILQVLWKSLQWCWYNKNRIVSRE